MRRIIDNGRFVFNQNRPLVFLGGSQNTNTPGNINNQPPREGHIVPSNPDNMPTETVDSEQHTPESLYTYSMGISEIQAHNRTYAESNAFVTKPIRLNENVLEVTLDSLEEHPVFEEVSGRASSRQTSVEYYLSLKETPGINDWLPILPKQTKRVMGERLFFYGLNAQTLFPFKLHDVRVYKDGIRLKNSDYYILNTQNIQVQNMEDGAVYTIDYTPATHIQDPYTIEVNDYKPKTERIVEEFPNGTDINRTLTLKHVPYIDRERLVQEEQYNPNTSDYRPIDVSIVQGRVRGPNGQLFNYVPPKKEREDSPYMVNRTLYLENSWSNMQRYDLESGYLGIDYYQFKNKITLAEHINIPMIEENEQETPGTGVLRVAYDALVTAFRLKVILRRNTQREKTATPRVKEYQLNFKAIK